MSNRHEFQPSSHFPEYSPKMQEKIARLDREFPGKIVILEKGTKLYRYDSHLSEILARGKFQLSKSQTGKFIHFNQNPGENNEQKPQIEATTSNTLILLDAKPIQIGSASYGSPVLRELESKKRLWEKDIIDVQRRLGFAGSIGASTSIYTPVDTIEVVLYQEGLASLINIQEYKDPNPS